VPPQIQHHAICKIVSLILTIRLAYIILVGPASKAAFTEYLWFLLYWSIGFLDPQRYSLDDPEIAAIVSSINRTYHSVEKSVHNDVLNRFPDAISDSVHQILVQPLSQPQFQSSRTTLRGQPQFVTELIRNLAWPHLTESVGPIDGPRQHSASGFVALHQLPPAPRDFTGREEEIQCLTAAIENGCTLLGIHGMGGVGKTALALTIAELFASRYPDAQLYLDLRASDPENQQAMNTRHAMEYVIHSYKPGLNLPEDEPEVVAIYRSVLYQQRVILLFDNIGVDNSIDILSPPASCLAIFTSRKVFTLPGMVDRTLHGLSPNPARDLLLRIAPRLAREKEDAINHLVQLCGYIPRICLP